MCIKGLSVWTGSWNSSGVDMGTLSTGMTITSDSSDRSSMGTDGS